jgi:hypothetical protein
MPSISGAGDSGADEAKEETHLGLEPLENHMRSNPIWYTNPWVKVLVTPAFQLGHYLALGGWHILIAITMNPFSVVAVVAMLLVPAEPAMRFFRMLHRKAPHLINQNILNQLKVQLSGERSHLAWAAANEGIHVWLWILTACVTSPTAVRISILSGCFTGRYPN